MTRLNRIETRLNDAGITTRHTTGADGQMILVAEHDYTGPYPTRESMHKADTVQRICSRYKGLHTERRGYYQATFIYPA